MGRTYEDFLAFLNKNPDVSIVQMDSVIGERVGKCLLTFHYSRLDFDKIKTILRYVYRLIMMELYQKLRLKDLIQLLLH